MRTWLTCKMMSFTFNCARSAGELAVISRRGKLSATPLMKMISVSSVQPPAASGPEKLKGAEVAAPYLIVDRFTLFFNVVLCLGGALSALMAGGYLSITLVPILTQRLADDDAAAARGAFTAVFRWPWK